MALQSYEHDTHRLEMLTRFVVAFVPCTGQVAGYDVMAETLAEPEVLQARDAALLDALQAIGQIARCSTPAGLKPLPAPRPPRAPAAKVSVEAAP